MSSNFIRYYLRFVAVVLSVTALAKLPEIFRLKVVTMCMEEPMFGRFQPFSNDLVLLLAAATEFVIVALVLFSPRRWVPCLAAATWGSICLCARLYFIVAHVDCGCFGWLAKPGPMTNVLATLLALALTIGGYKAFGIAWRDPKQILATTQHRG